MHTPALLALGAKTTFSSILGAKTTFTSCMQEAAPGMQGCQQGSLRPRRHATRLGHRSLPQVPKIRELPLGSQGGSAKAQQAGPHYSAAEAAISPKQPGPHCSAAKAASRAVLLRQRHLRGTARRGTARGGCATMRRRPEPGWQRVRRARMCVPPCSQRACPLQCQHVQTSHCPGAGRP